MNGKQKHTSIVNNGESPVNVNSESVSVMSIEQLQRLVRLLDRSDVSELELKHGGDGIRLVLRKAKAPENTAQMGEAILNAMTQSSAGHSPSASTPTATETRHTITAHLVGIFHTWARPRGGVLVAIGDHIKVGQLVATIESLNVINEVESTVAGRVVEILVQEGQPIEYGQHLMVIDSTEEQEGA